MNEHQVFVLLAGGYVKMIDWLTAALTSDPQQFPASPTALEYLEAERQRSRLLLTAAQKRHEASRRRSKKVEV